MRSATNPQARIDSMRLNHKQIAACTGGSFMVEPLDPRALATGLTWDSRDAKPGDVYVALPGERVDGHDFVGAALSGGAVCALVMQPLDEAVRMLAAELGASVIEVPDTAHAVADIAREWRSHLHGRVIALTGSTGKTTTKNLVRDVLASTLSTVATAGNQNNELGVPKTLLAAEQDTQAVVVEMGMRGAGQLADLCDYVRPDWGLVVNVGESHIELLGSRENIARAKAELLCALPEGTGRAFVNADDDYADFVREHARLDARRVETVLRGERYDEGFWAAARRVGLAALAVVLLVSSSLLFGLPDRFHVTEENLLVWPGVYLRGLLGNEVDESEAVWNDDGWYLLNAGGRPYGAAAVLVEDYTASVYLEFPAAMPEAEVEENIARLQARLTAALGEPLTAGESLLVWMERLLTGGESQEAAGERLGVWRGQTDSGTATVTLTLWPGGASHTPETEGGMLVGLLWNED